jgi:hypothetical protein
MGDFNFDMAAEFARRAGNPAAGMLYYHSAVHTGQDVVGSQS